MFNKKNWRLQLVHWLHTVVVRPLITYGATVRWPKFKLKTSKVQLSELQSLAFLGVSGAIRTYQTAVMEIHLGLHPLHLHWEAESRAGIYAIQYSDQWKTRSFRYGYAYIVQDIKK
jgi:hypothetical protein